MGRSFGILDSRILKGSTVGSKSEGRHEGGTRDPRRDHVRIPKEIVLIPEPAVAEFLANHERVPEKNRACKGCSKGAQRGCPRNRKPPCRPGSADPTAPEQALQVPGLRELRLAESEQILPSAGNRKPLLMYGPT